MTLTLIDVYDLIPGSTSSHRWVLEQITTNWSCWLHKQSVNVCKWLGYLMMSRLAGPAWFPPAISVWMWVNVTCSVKLLWVVESYKRKAREKAFNILIIFTNWLSQTAACKGRFQTTGPLSRRNTNCLFHTGPLWSLVLHMSGSRLLNSLSYNELLWSDSAI